MNEKQLLLAGIEIKDAYCQISYFDFAAYEPVSVMQSEDSKTTRIPAVLGVRHDTREWIFGEEAVAEAKEGRAIAIEGILKNIAGSKPVRVFDVEFTPQALQERYLRKCLQLLRKIEKTKPLGMLVITLEKQEEQVREILLASLKEIGVEESCVRIISQSQSFMHFALGQKKELWLHDVGMFELDERGLVYRQLVINRHTHPVTVGIKEKRFADALHYEDTFLPQMREQCQNVFAESTKTALHKQVVSAIYMTGIGFEHNWADGVFAKLCANYRVFRGNSLYVEGACYAARRYLNHEKMEEFLFLSEEMVSKEITMHVYHDAAMAEVVLARPGVAWYDSVQSLDVILDEESEVELIVRNSMTQDTISHILSLDGIANKPNKTTRVRIHAYFTDAKNCVIHIRDMGFGEFYPSSNRVWEKYISMDSVK